MKHLTAESAARWVAGLSEGPEAAALESHVSTCPECAALLRHEARAELALGRAARREPRRSAWRMALVPLFAAAAVLAISLSIRPAIRPPARCTRLEAPHYEGSTPHEMLKAPAPL